jgi:hypothetical protein
LREKYVMGYAAADDFSLPATAFLICRFCLVGAACSIGRRQELWVISMHLHTGMDMRSYPKGCFRRLVDGRSARPGVIGQV